MPNSPRPHLTPADPRGGFQHHPDFDVYGQFDQGQIADLNTGEAHPAPFNVSDPETNLYG